MKWTDTYDIAAALYDKFPDVDPVTIRFTDLRKWVLELDGFSDLPSARGKDPRSDPGGVDRGSGLSRRVGIRSDSRHPPATGRHRGRSRSSHGSTTIGPASDC